LGTSSARDTKFLKTVDLYWHIKTFLGKITLDNEEDNEEIMKQIVKVHQQLQDIQARIENQERHEEYQKANSP
jgi:hypothetical protein